MAARLEKGRWICEIFPRQNWIASAGDGGRQVEDGYFKICICESGQVVMSLSLTEAGGQVRGSRAFSLVRVSLS